MNDVVDRNSKESVKRMTIHANVMALREQPATNRVGLKWSSEEDSELMSQATTRMTLDDIAHAHKRTITAIKLRIMSNALIMMKEKGLSLDEVSKIVNISKEDLELHKEREGNKLPKKAPPCGKHEMPNDVPLDLLVEIRDLLKVIVEQTKQQQQFPL